MTQPSYWLYRCPSVSKRCTLDLTVVRSRLPGASICAVPLSQPFPGKNYLQNRLLFFDDSDKFPRTLYAIVVKVSSEHKKVHVNNMTELRTDWLIGYYAVGRDKSCTKTISINKFSSERVDSEGLMKAPVNGAPAVVKAQGSIAGLLFFLPFSHSRKIFADHFVTGRVDFGTACSIKFFSSSAFLGFRKVLEEDVMSSSVSGRKVQNACEI